MADDRETAKNNGISNHHLPRTQRAPQFRIQCGRSQDLVSLREEEEEIQRARRQCTIGGNRNSGKEVEREREGSRLFSDGKEEEGGRKLSAGI